MKSTWILSGLMVLATILSAELRAENFFPFSHDKVAHSTDLHSNGEYQKQSIDEVIADSTDDELVKLSGEIIKKLKCSTYLFRDKTGEIRVHIENDSIPKKGLLFGSPVTIKGEVIKESGKPLSVDADKIRYMF